MNRLSLDHLTVLDATPRELIEAAAAGGFDAVGLRIVPPMPTDVITPVIGKTEVKREIKQLTKDTGVKIGMVEAVWLTPDTSVPDLEAALETGAELGANLMLVCGNDPNVERLVENLSALATVARKYELDLGLEFMSYVGLRTFEEAEKIIRRSNQTNVRLLIDAIHLSRSGKHPKSLGKLSSNEVGYVHLCDAVAEIPPPEKLREEGRYGRLYPGEGSLCLSDFMDAMPDGVPIGVEAPCRTYASLPPIERGRIVGQATHKFLKQYYNAKAKMVETS